MLEKEEEDDKDGDDDDETMSVFRKVAFRY
jgi:hypothetical protein